MTGPPAAFDVHGFRFAIQGSCKSALAGVSHDFAFFRSDLRGDETSIELLDQEPDYGSLPGCDASICTPRNTVYRVGDRSYLDYHGKGLGVHQSGASSFRVFSRNADILYEAAYLFLMSRIGEVLDQKRLHRVHALGVAVNGRAVLVLLPMGGGKSTLGAYLLRHPDVKLLSDDSPFVDPTGRAHAFPLHVGLLAGSEGTVPREHTRFLNRMEFGPKYLVNYEYFAGQVCASADPGIVFLGRRTLAPEARMEPAGLRAGLRSMVANCVVGMGLFHGLEFILESSPWELGSKACVGWSRLRNSLTLLRRSQVYHLYLSRDLEGNAAAVVQFARKHLS